MRLEPLPSSVPKLKAQPNVSPIADNSTSYCRSCNYQFARRRNYRLHLMTAHKVKLEPLKGVPRLKPQSNIIPIIDDPNNTCRSCNYQFVSKYAYRNHLMKTHKRKSESLPKRLEFEPLPKRLPPVVDDPNNNCRSCNYQFSGRRAYRKHLMNLHKLELEPSRKSIPKLKAQPSILPVVDDPNHTCQSW
jgi:transposase-like protein